MKKDEDSQGLNQIFEIINAKGDTGEINEIIEKAQSSNQTQGNEGDYSI